MSDQGSGFPPEQVEGERAPVEGEWQTVPPASYGGTPPPPPGAGYPPPPGYVAPPPGWAQQQQAAQATGLSSNSAAALSYIAIIPAIFFLLADPYKRDEYVRFHAWQCISLFLVGVVGQALLTRLGFLGWMTYILLCAAIAVYWLIALVKASHGERYHIPGVGDLAEHLTRSVPV